MTRERYQVSPRSRLLDSSAVRYLGVGGLSFLIDLGLLALVYRVVGAPLWLATAAGFWGSVFANFWLQRRFAFGSDLPAGHALVRYGALLLVNTVINVVVVEWFQRAGLGYATGKATVTAAQTVWNYVLYRLWVFPRPGAGLADV
ncbi:GtrA family protein [Cellulomonas fengjieae]|uniref:GtrA family protein n=1 Tax=Cellulomonas fengjieae TaxID=2819978 RepID=A0ABS3SDN3_9CELL|nr:GtrA family protein [Cellulomonas fengjieae]MBO3083858.1 GtrA family protein [Cellulomonas fengjieae]QVI64856.1 GtrA family protein [Cellulomonas fengjieae]